ncbi:hypothetical protein ABFO71_07940 [Acinetobacter seifertii]
MSDDLTLDVLHQLNQSKPYVHRESVPEGRLALQTLVPNAKNCDQAKHAGDRVLV